MALAAWSTVHHHYSLEVSYGAGDGVHPVIVGERTGAAGGGPRSAFAFED
jgi:hypothetical protein